MGRCQCLQGICRTPQPPRAHKTFAGSINVKQWGTNVDAMKLCAPISPSKLFSTLYIVISLGRKVPRRPGRQTISIPIYSVQLPLIVSVGPPARTSPTRDVTLSDFAADAFRKWPKSSSTVPPDRCRSSWRRNDGPNRTRAWWLTEVSGAIAITKVVFLRSRVPLPRTGEVPMGSPPVPATHATFAQIHAVRRQRHLHELDRKSLKSTIGKVGLIASNGDTSNEIIKPLSFRDTEIYRSSRLMNS